MPRALTRMVAFQTSCLPAFLLAAVLAAPGGNARAQLGEMNLLTDLGTPFPPGCLSISLPQQPRRQDSLLVDQTLNVPSVNSTVRDASVRVRIWRVACADEGFSAVLVRMRQLGDPDEEPPVVVPRVFAEAGQVDTPLHVAHLQQLPAAGIVGATGDIISPTTGITWLLAVELLPVAGSSEFLPQDYNETFTLELNWGSFSVAQPEAFVFVLDRFEPSLDLPQFDQPVLNGRFSGQWVRPGAPRQALVLQIAEEVDTNFVFAIFFTYLDGQPIWVTGNTGKAPAEPGDISMDVVTLENGAFFTDANQPAPEDVQQTIAGNIRIEVLDCNRLRLHYDFTPLGKGSGNVELERLIRIAGYDCNPWE